MPLPGCWDNRNEAMAPTSVVGITDIVIPGVKILLHDAYKGKAHPCVSITTRGLDTQHY